MASRCKPAGRFTPVGKEELDRAESSPKRPPIISLQTVILAVSLAAVAASIVYFLQPPTREGLFKRIDSRRLQ